MLVLTNCDYNIITLYELAVCTYTVAYRYTLIARPLQASHCILYTCTNTYHKYHTLYQYYNILHIVLCSHQ